MTKGALSRRVAMSKTNHFRQYAEEAMRSAHQSKIQDEKEAFIELARTWTAAADAERTDFCRQRQSA